jgi:hypothetical protein
MFFLLIMTGIVRQLSPYSRCVHCGGILFYLYQQRPGLVFIMKKYGTHERQTHVFDSCWHAIIAQMDNWWRGSSPGGAFVVLSHDEATDLVHSKAKRSNYALPLNLYISDSYLNYGSLRLGFPCANVSLHVCVGLLQYYIQSGSITILSRVVEITIAIHLLTPREHFRRWIEMLPRATNTSRGTIPHIQMYMGTLVLTW